ncbi:MAG: serine/threonine-protein kinase [Oscillospiraceae bacterium]
MRTIYQYLLSSIDTEYETVKTIKNSERGCVSLLQNKQNGTRFIFRHYRGNGEVYRKLLGISCPNLPQIMEAAESGGMVAVLEEYIQGDSLAYLLEGALFTPAEARKITLQLCNALWVLHTMGAVHRDIKPENVIVRGSETVLIDFDASRIFKSESSTDTQILGTTGYAAPEQYGISQTDERADIYSVGVLLNIMLTGKHPSKELAGGRLGRIVQKCTMVNPKKRYKNVLYLMEAL